MTKIVNGVIMKEAPNASIETIDFAQKIGGSKILMIIAASGMVIFFGFKGFGVLLIGYIAYKIFFEHSGSNSTISVVFIYYCMLFSALLKIASCIIGVCQLFFVAK